MFKRKQCLWLIVPIRAVPGDWGSKTHMPCGRDVSGLVHGQFKHESLEGCGQVGCGYWVVGACYNEVWRV